MVTKVVGDIYSSNINIIYNAVSVDRKNQYFSDSVKGKYPEVYDEYLDAIRYAPTAEIGEIQLVGAVTEKQFIFNGFVWDKKRKLNMVAFVKTLVELHNLADNYNITVGFPKDFIKSKIWSKETIFQIIEEVFEKSNVHAYIYE